MTPQKTTPESPVQPISSPAITHPQSPPASQPTAGAKEPCDATVFEPIPEPCEGNGSKNVQAKGGTASTFGVKRQNVEAGVTEATKTLVVASE